MTSNTIPIITNPDDSPQSLNAFPDPKRALNAVADISGDDLRRAIQCSLVEVSKLLKTETTPGTRVDAVTVRFSVSVNGDVRLVAGIGAGAAGGIEVVVKSQE